MKINQANELLSQDYFKLFLIPQDFKIDQTKLQQNYLDLQRQFHPDNYINSDTVAKSIILKLSAHINQGYTTLKNPLLRGALLLKLNNVDLKLSEDTKLPNEFLMEQMELHEEIFEAKSTNDFIKLENIEKDVEFKEKQLINEIEHNFTLKDYVAVKELLKQLKFYTRLKDTVVIALEN